MKFRAASLMFLCLGQKPPYHPFSQSSPLLWQMVQGKLLPAALLGLGEEGMATALLFLGYPARGAEKQP